jgi:hypothetical protein
MHKLVRMLLFPLAAIQAQLLLRTGPARGGCTSAS